MRPREFEGTVLPHLDAAFNYARWLARNETEAEDVVQDACVRAMRFFSSLRDDDARPWLLAIVRNTWYSRVSRRGTTMEAALDTTGDEPPDDREVLVLREMEGLSYKEIAAVVQVPLGTVMSRLARARERLLALLRLSPDMEALR